MKDINEKNFDFKVKYNNYPIKKNQFKLKIIFILIALLILTLIILLIVVLSKKSKAKKNNNINRGTNKSEHLYIEPSSGVHTHTIIFMPGLTSKPEDFKEVFTERIPFQKKNTTKVVLLRSPLRNVRVLNGQKNHSWFDIYYFPLNSTDSYNFTEMKNSSNFLKQMIKEEADILGGNYNKIIIGGHSQGAIISLYTGYKSCDKMIGGILAFSGFLPEEDALLPGKNDLNVYYAYGDIDPVIIPEYFNTTVKDIMNYEGFKMYIYPNHVHFIKEEEMIDAGKFLDTIMQ